jgi:hypothetical protein
MLFCYLCLGLAKWSLPTIKLYVICVPVYSTCLPWFITQTVSGEEMVLCTASWYSCLPFCFRCVLSYILISSSASCCLFVLRSDILFSNLFSFSVSYILVSSSATCCHVFSNPFTYSIHHDLPKHNLSSFVEENDQIT